MPSSTKKQHNFMLAVSHSPAFAKKVGIPQSVGSDFEKADKGRKFAKGGETMATKKMMGEGDMMDKSQDKAMIKKAFKQHDAQEHKGGKGTSLELKRGGMAKKMAGGGFTRAADGVAQKGKTKGMQVKMTRGGKC